MHGFLQCGNVNVGVMSSDGQLI